MINDSLKHSEIPLRLNKGGALVRQSAKIQPNAKNRMKKDEHMIAGDRQHANHHGHHPPRNKIGSIFEAKRPCERTTCSLGSMWVETCVTLQQLSIRRAGRRRIIALRQRVKQGGVELEFFF